MTESLSECGRAALGPPGMAGKKLQPTAAAAGPGGGGHIPRPELGVSPCGQSSLEPLDRPCSPCATASAPASPLKPALCPLATPRGRLAVEVSPRSPCRRRDSCKAGPLTKVMICEDKEGKPKSFGYVCFKHKVSVPYAKALLDGICLYGRPITVQYWRGSSPSPQPDSCTDGFEHYIDLESPADRHQELSGNPPFPVTPLPVNNSLLHDHPGFQEVNQTAQFKTARSYPEFSTSK
ncbi:uncharacterized protein LOC118698747 [Molothrus ater]|uniref:uncharacterized protein LOC118698747 n=1 Tax=Molothrus ater TaxID=84834 RepID=UPI00174925D0|nr:uncharacterized protein LOC118698747 [Molothrus ater]